MFSENSIAKGLRILVVEDHFFMAGLVSQILRGLGADRVDIVPNGVKAVQKLNSSLYHLAICDIAMEPFNGLQLLAAIRAGVTDADKELPVIMLTGHIDFEMRAAAKGLAANGFLPKPMSWNSLSAEVARVLSDDAPLEIPPLNKEHILQGLNEAKVKNKAIEKEDEEEDLRYIGHVYRSQDKRKRKRKVSKPSVSAPVRIAGRTHLRSVDKLNAGDVLAADVIAGDGRKLLSKGIELSRAKVKLLKEQGRAFGITEVRIHEGP